MWNGEHEHKNEDSPPGATAVPDNQGVLDVCTGYSLGKAVVNGFMTEKFVADKIIDIDQGKVTSLLVNEHKVCFVKFANSD